MFIGGWAMSGGSKKPAQQAPPINASSKDEENFIQYVSSARALRKCWQEDAGRDTNTDIADNS